jgi:hypothetical protein
LRPEAKADGEQVVGVVGAGGGGGGRGGKCPPGNAKGGPKDMEVIRDFGLPWKRQALAHRVSIVVMELVAPACPSSLPFNNPAKSSCISPFEIFY